MRKFLFLKIFILFFILIALVIWFVNQFILPKKARALLLEALKSHTNRNVTVESIHYNLFKGIIVKNIIIFDNPQYGNRQFLFIEKVSFNFLYFPILKEKKIYIPAINVQNPNLVIETQAEGAWNFSDMPFIDEITRPKKTKQKFSFIVRKINIFDGKIILIDKTQGPVSLKEIAAEEIRLLLALPAVIKFRGSFEVKGTKETLPTKIKLSGEIQPHKKYASLNFVTKELSITEYTAYYKDFIPIKILSGEADLKAQFVIKNDNLTGNLIADITKLRIKEGDFESTADAIFSADLKYSLGQKTSFTYNGKMSVKDCTIKGLPFINTVNSASGKLSLSEQQLNVEELNGLAYDCPVSLEGHLKDYETPYIDFLVKIDFDLSKLKFILPKDAQENFKDIKASGKSLINAQLKGLVGKETPLEFIATLPIQDAKVQMPILQKQIIDLEGNVSVYNNKLIWKDISFKYGDYNVSSSGSIVDFNNPYVDLSLVSKDLALSSNFNIKDLPAGQAGKTIFLNKFEGKFLNSDFSFLGNISDFSNPLLNIYGNVKLDLKGIRLSLPKQIQELFGSLNITGVCDASMLLNGRWKDWRNWELTIKAQSNQIAASGFKLSNVFIDYRMKDRFVYLREMTANPYEGVFFANASLNLESPDNPYLVNAEVKDARLELLKQDTPFAKKDISGLLNIKVTLNGYGMGLDKLKGSGWLYIKDGKLWEIPLLRPMADLLFMPSFEKITFRDAVGSFIIQDKYIYTSDLQFISNEVIISWDGRLGFDKTLDFSVTTQATEEFVAKSTPLGKITTTILGQAGRFIDTRLTGTLAEPKYTIVPFPVGKILQKDVIKKIKDVFGDIFE